MGIIIVAFHKHKNKEKHIVMKVLKCLVIVKESSF